MDKSHNAPCRVPVPQINERPLGTHLNQASHTHTSPHITSIGKHFVAYVLIHNSSDVFNWM